VYVTRRSSAVLLCLKIEFELSSLCYCICIRASWWNGVVERIVWRLVHLLGEDRGCYREEWGKTGPKNSTKKTRRTAGNDTGTENDNETPRMNKEMNGVVGFVLNCYYSSRNWFP
jgi:hypothetical protein